MTPDPNRRPDPRARPTAPRAAQPSRGIPLESLGQGPVGLSVLTIARHYFASFAAPAQQGWLAATATALETFGDTRGPHVAVAVLSAVQAMRRARASVFRFNSPGCPCCAGFASDHERAFLASLRAVAEGRMEAAAGHAFLLCEGNDAAPFLSALVTLAEVCEMGEKAVMAPDLGNL